MWPRPAHNAGAEPGGPPRSRCGSTTCPGPALDWAGEVLVRPNAGHPGGMTAPPGSWRQQVGREWFGDWLYVMSAQSLAAVLAPTWRTSRRARLFALNSSYPLAGCRLGQARSGGSHWRSRCAGSRSGGTSPAVGRTTASDGARLPDTATNPVACWCWMATSSASGSCLGESGDCWMATRRTRVGPDHGPVARGCNLAGTSVTRASTRPATNAWCCTCPNRHSLEQC